MTQICRHREALADVRRVVVKVGTRVLVQKTGRPDVRRLQRLAGELAQMQREGRDVALVTSGAIGAGMEALGMKERPSALPDLQMAAAVGQSRLMARYDSIFGRLGCKVGQILLTHGDFQHKVRLTNARRTIENLLRHKVIPIINENDVVADEEIKADLALGDNDLLASLVVKLVRADLLVLLTTVDGLLAPTESGRKRRISCIEEINRGVFSLVHGHDARLSRGGMDSKLRAAQSVTRSGCAAVIANGRETGVLGRIMRGEDAGTLIVADAV